MKKNNLKIGVVVDQLLPGGVQIAAIEEVKNLRELGYSAELLILMRKKYSLQFQSMVEGIPYRFLSDYYPWPFQSTLKFPIFAFLSTLHLLSPFLAPRVIKDKEYDFLISHGTTTCFTTLALWRHRKIPYLAVIHDPIVYILKKVYSQTVLKFFFSIFVPLSYFLEKKFVNEAQATIIVSDAHQKFLRDKYGIEPTILFHGCHVLKTIPKHRGSLILAISRWQSEKNPTFLLHLLKSIPRARLRIAGVWLKENDLSKFKKEMTRLNLEKRVEINNGFESRDLKKFFQEARVLVHPHFEAFGMGALEAAAHGVPIIMPAGSGATNLFEKNVDGFFPKKVTQKEYLQYLNLLLSDEKLAYKMGLHAWIRVKDQYSWLAHTKKLVSLGEDKLRQLASTKITAIEIGHAGPTGLAGGDRLFEEMVKRIPPEDFQIEVITSIHGSQHWKESKLNINLTVLPRNPFEIKLDPVSVFISYLIRIFQVSSYLVKKEKLEGILYSSTNVLPDILPCFVAKLANSKIKWHCRFHHLIPPPFQREGRIIVNIVSYFMQILSLYFARSKANLTIALNTELSDELLKRGFKKNRLVVLGAGIDFTKISSYNPKKKEPFTGVYLGRLHTTKGIFDTLEIWEKVVAKKPEAKLAIIGDGSTEIKKELQERIKEKKMEEKIKILGYLPEMRVYDILKSAKVFLFTDHEAGWGLAIAEAMACQLPVIGWDIGVLGEVFKEGFIKVPCFDCQVFAKRLIRLLNDDRTRRGIANQAFDQAKKLSWEETTHKFREILYPTYTGLHVTNTQVGFIINKRELPASPRGEQT